MNRPTHFTAGNPEFRPRNKCLVPLISCCLIFLLADFARAGSGTWKRHARSGDWNTKTNWTPAHVPNGSADMATFGLSNTTDVSLSANTEVNGITFTAAATNPYTITANPGLTLTISGMGITNNSGITQDVHIPVDASNNGGTIAFSNSATAGSNVSIFNDGGTINFLNTSTAGSATIANFGTFPGNPTTNFFNRSSAGNSTIYTTSGGSVLFANNSTAGSAEFILIYRFSLLQFANNSTAANSTIGTAYSSFMEFSGSSTAGSASIGVTDGSFLTFDDHSRAGSATIEAFASIISFEGSSRGGTAQIGLAQGPYFHSSGLDISGHNGPGVTIGSLEGDEGAFVDLGANNLTIGSNNLSTTFSGVMQDGDRGGNGGTGGSLTKIGTGTLDLTGANTYTGNTNINRGVLKVDGSITSNTFVNHGGTLAGTGTVGGNVTNAGVVSPGDAPGTLTVNGNYAQASNGTLLIDIAGANDGQFSVLDVLGNANLDGFLHPVLLNGFTPTIGESFTFLDYASLTGAFSSIQNQVFDNGMERWVVTYQATDAVLTATRNVPDLGSTLLLLTLSLLGLATYRQKCWE
jgi:autotransporter-associated beta strand protein